MTSPKKIHTYFSLKRIRGQDIFGIFEGNFLLENLTGLKKIFQIPILIRTFE